MNSKTKWLYIKLYEKHIIILILLKHITYNKFIYYQLMKIVQLIIYLFFFLNEFSFFISFIKEEKSKINYIKYK